MSRMNWCLFLPSAGEGKGKRDGTDRHWAGGGPVEIDSDVLDEYLEMVTPTVRAKILKRLARS